MKKALSILIAAVLILTVGGCAGAGEKSDAAEFSRGVVKGSSYISEFAGFSAELPEEYEFYTDEQIAEVNGVTADALDGQNSDVFKNALESGQSLTDMFAAGADGLSTVNVTIENLEVSGNKDMTESEYAALGSEQLKKALENIGYSVSDIKSAEKEFAGAKHPAITVEWQYSGRKGYETVICKKVGKYMVNVTACTWEENTTDFLISCFKSI